VAGLVATTSVVFTTVTMIVKNALHTHLLRSRASRSRTTTVRVKHTFDTLLLSQRASGGIRGAVSITFTGIREDASRVFATFGSASFSSAPVVQRTLITAGALNTAATKSVAVRGTVV